MIHCTIPTEYEHRKEGSFMSKIYINAGHGGKDPGAVNGNRKESHDVLRLAKSVQPFLIAAGHTVVMSRTDDIYTEVSAIAAHANASKANYFIALHRNSHTTASATGNELLICSTAGASSRKLAEAILARITKVGGVNRGVKVQDHRTVVLKKTTMPAVTVELGFISNSSDNSLYDSRFNDFAAAIADGICDVAGRNNTGAITNSKDGWKIEEGLWSYMKDRKKVTGWQQLPWGGGTDWFYFGANGVMVTGRQVLEWQGKTDIYYFSPVSGNMCKSRWVKDVDGKEYYHGKNGIMVTNSFVPSKDGSKVYWVDDNGVWNGREYNLAV